MWRATPARVRASGVTSRATRMTQVSLSERFQRRIGPRHVWGCSIAQRQGLWADLSGYDIVVCAEVIEHLPISPMHVLRLLEAALRPGGWLVLQTPNAARIGNRVRLLAGCNPFEPLREDSVSPGHFREYTVAE